MIKKNYSLLIVSIAAFIFLLLLAFIVWNQRLVRLDLLATQYLQSFINRNFDTPLSFLSLLGSGEITAMIVVLIGYLAYSKSKKVFWGLSFFLLIIIFEFIGKILIYHPSPPARFFRYDIPFFFPSAYVKMNYSFPSGHVSRTIFLVVIGIFVANIFIREKVILWIVRLSLIAIGILMMVSRVYLGEHWFSDVLGGTALGISLGSLAILFW